MGSLGKDDGRTESSEGTTDDADVNRAETRASACQLLPSLIHGKNAKGGNGDELQYLQNTMPYFDTVPVEDAFETQAVNFADETQLMDITGDTQVLDDIDVAENMETQLLGEFDEGIAVDSDIDSLETDKTEVLGDGNELTDDDPTSTRATLSVDRKKIQSEPRSTHSEKTVEQIDTLTDEKHSSVYKPPRFTFIRAQALREVALAARNRALKEADSDAYSTLSATTSLERINLENDCKFCSKYSDEKRGKGDQGQDNEECCKKDKEHCTVTSAAVRKLFNDEPLADQELDHEECSRKDKEHCAVTSAAVRKLFNDELPAEIRGSSHSSCDVNGYLLKSSEYDGQIAGLSYVNSQEPGDLSQTNALAFVDRLLKDNILGFDDKGHHENGVHEMSKTLPGAKGQQGFAKRATVKRKMDSRIGIFDWDDNCEDEGGGDIMHKIKEELLGNERHRRRSFPLPQKGILNKQNEHGDLEQLNIHIKRSVGHMNSKLMRNVKGNDKPMQESQIKCQRKIVNKLDQQYNIDSSRGQLEVDGNVTDDHEIADVGLDTQMAAEAMEALSTAEGILDHNIDNTNKVIGSKSIHCYTRKRKGQNFSEKTSSRKKVCLSDVENGLGESRRITRSGTKLDMQPKVSASMRGNVGKLCKNEHLKHGSNGTISNSEETLTSGTNKDKGETDVPNKVESALKSSCGKESSDCTGTVRVRKGGVVKIKDRHTGISQFTPIAKRTRRSSVSQLKNPEASSRNCVEKNCGPVEVGSHKRGNGFQVTDLSNTKSSNLCSGQFGNVENKKLSHLEQLDLKSMSVSNVDKFFESSFPTRRRSLRNLSHHVEESVKLDGLHELSIRPGDIGRVTATQRRLRNDALSNCVDEKQEGKTSGKVADEIGENPNSNGKTPAKSFSSIGCLEVDSNLGESPKERCISSDIADVNPACYKTTADAVSPICMGNGYLQESCQRKKSRSCLRKEVRCLSATAREFATSYRDSRKRRDLTDVRVLISHHLDEDTIKHQKKILACLGASVAFSITDATHFVADQFVRTRNMLEAIASGKPVVTHLWLESCGQASCFIDEKNYILRDAKKEKELGFNMPVSLVHASQHPLLEGLKVFITPNVKPSKEIISSLVKAVHGQAVERIGRTSLKDDKIPDDLLVLSCEEDYSICVPLLEKGAAVYSSELLLSGIVIQKLEYERHHIFTDYVKRTRSTIWMKSDGNRFLPVTKCRT